MIQDIAPHVLKNQMRFDAPAPDDAVMAFDDRSLLVAQQPLDEQGQLTGDLRFPTVAELGDATDLVYLLSVDDQRFYLALPWGRDDGGCASESSAESSDLGRGPIALDGFAYRTMTSLRGARPLYLDYAAMTAYQLYRWYLTNRFCGRCGRPMRLDDVERAITCDHCGNKVYPKIMPAVIVAVVDGDRILVTRYARQASEYRQHALIAGFCEIGETAEQTVAREVMEETGVAVKNVRYYKSQPWGLASDLLLGYFCELDGDPTITMDPGELSEAVWLSRGEMVEEDDHYSLTREMMMCFKYRTLPFL